MKTDKRLAEAFRFHVVHGGYIVGSRALCAIRSARAEIRAADLERMSILRFLTETDDDYASSLDKRDESDQRELKMLRDGTLEVYTVSLQMRDSDNCGHTDTDRCDRRCGWRTEASLGGCTVLVSNQRELRDYLRTIRADLAIESDLSTPADPLPLPAGASRCVI